ncbi:unnamed protein product [Protopolystoma xenopodis]|uniref:Uncharacterized protein n=1 Tax=Protopolystoma xenopodis TaxID=117903 RepID=A0A3S5FD72_9PLAT|nr:unnamed protein product [Protopolystoma xenopodis]
MCPHTKICLMAEEQNVDMQTITCSFSPTNRSRLCLLPLTWVLDSKVTSAAPPSSVGEATSPRAKHTQAWASGNLVSWPQPDQH